MDSSSSSSDEFPIFQKTFPSRSNYPNIKRYELIWKSTDSCDSDSEDELQLRSRNHKHRARYSQFNRWNEQEFLKKFRMHKDTALFILSQIEAEIATPLEKNRQILPMDQLLLVLRLLGSSNVKKTIAEFSGMCQASIRKILRNVVTAIARLRGQYITTAQSVVEKLSCRKKFEEIAGFPRIVGVLVTTHVKIKSPGENISKPFRNNSNFYSLKVQILTDANQKIQDIEAEWPGGTDDETLLKNTRLYSRLRSGEFGDSIVLADKSYALKKYVITPLRNAETEEEKAFQLAHSKTYDVGCRILKAWRQRFPILTAELRLSLGTSRILIVAAAVLYNICKMRNDIKPPNDREMCVEGIEVTELPNNEFEEEDYREPFIQHFMPKDCLTD